MAFGMKQVNQQRDALLAALQAGLDPQTAGPMVSDYLGQVDAIQAQRQEAIGGLSGLLTEQAMAGVPSDDAARILEASLAGMGAGKVVSRNAENILGELYPGIEHPGKYVAAAGAEKATYSPLYQELPVDEQDVAAINSSVRQSLEAGLDKQTAVSNTLTAMGLQVEDPSTGEMMLVDLNGQPQFVTEMVPSPDGITEVPTLVPNPAFDGSVHSLVENQAQYAYQRIGGNMPGGIPGAGLDAFTQAVTGPVPTTAIEEAGANIRGALTGIWP